LSEKNLDHVERLLWDLEVHPSIHMSIIQLGWFTTAAAGGKYERELKERFGACGLSWKGFEDNSAPKRSRPVFELVQRIKNGHFRKPVLFFPDLDGERILRYYSDPSDTLAMKGCKALYRDAHIMPNGDVVVCGDFPDMVLGNVSQQSLREIWKGERIRQFRQSIEKQGLFSICPRCCGFFE
jgi:radical SAM protein with 4Fe4S-binding SPASM domain